MQGFCWGIACVTHAGPGHNKASFRLLPTFRRSGAWPPGGCNSPAQAAFPVYQAFYISLRLGEELVPHVCSTSTRCKHEYLTSDLRCCPQRHDAIHMCLDHDDHSRSDVWACRRYGSSPTADPSQVQLLTSVLTLAMQSQVLQAR